MNKEGKSSAVTRNMIYLFMNIIEVSLQLSPSGDIGNACLKVYAKEAQRSAAINELVTGVSNDPSIPVPGVVEAVGTLNEWVEQISSQEYLQEIMGIIDKFIGVGEELAKVGLDTKNM